jgi:uncharacterized protein YdhG (YjbR/CyaY superfamily)
VSAATVDEYLAAVPADRRAVLEHLRGLIRDTVPDATEAMAYGMPSFRLGGRWLVGYATTKQGLSLYAGGLPTQRYADEIERAGYRTWKGTINFPVERPLSDELVTKLLEARVAEFRGG